MDPEQLAKIVNDTISTVLDKHKEEQARQMSEFQIAMEEKMKVIQSAYENDKPKIKIEPDLNPPTFHVDHDSNSNASDSSEVEFIKKMVNPVYKNQDQNIKFAQDKLQKIQAKLEANIPKLTFSTSEAVNHNYTKWRTALIKYYRSLSPVFADTTLNWLNSLNIEELVQNNRMPEFPVLSEAEYPEMVQLAAMTALQSSVSSDFEHLIDNETMTDIFPSLFGIHCVCRPGSDDDKASELCAFWDMKMDATQTATKFGRKLAEARKIYNDSSDDKISDKQLMAALKNGIRKGAQYDRYEKALQTMSYKMKNPPFHVATVWLDLNCDKTQSTSSTPSTSKPQQQASAARTRGGKTGGKGGKGRGGKGANRGGRGGKGRGNEPDGQTVWKNSYYKVEDEDGNTTITKEISDYRSSRPCFTKFSDGKCDDPDCPYSHDFNLETAKTTSRVPPQRAIASAASEDTQQESKQSSSYSAQPDDNYGHDSEFDYAHDLGFSASAASCATLSSSSDKKNPINSFVDATIDIFLLLPILALLPVALETVTAILTTVTALLGDVTPGRLGFVLCSSLFCLYCARARRSDVRWSASAAGIHFVSMAVKSLAAQYKVILDCGCTFTMSGDISIFDKSSLIPIDESVGLAESGMSVNATHYGKIHIGNRTIDALYVPDFKQTMVSMGQLEKMGLRYAAMGNMRNFLTPNGSIFLSFELANNNLYNLASSPHSTSSSTSNA